MGRSRTRSYLLAVAGWTAATILFVLIRYVGLESVPQFQGLDFDQINHTELTLKALGIGLILGSAFFLLDRLLDKPAIRRRPYGALILIQTVANLGFVILVLVFVTLVDYFRLGSDSLGHMLAERAFSTNFLVAFIYITLVSFLFSFCTQVNRKFGPGNLWKLIVGTYHHPREEELIFMFLDLKGSTTHAERLGHVRFSQLIQDCFIDLSVVIDHQAQIYQYVGDEVILYWEIQHGLHQANCLQAYFEFVDRLQARADYYQDTYGLHPVFKAGMNIGSATVLEVGEIKREISYLGDVLNTAARIQGKCNDYEEDLLVSEPLRDRFDHIPSNLELKTIGSVELRGREKPISICSVHRLG